MDVLIQIPEQEIEIVGFDTDVAPAPMGRNGESIGKTLETVTGNISEKVFENASKLIFNMADSLKKQFTDDNKPDEMEIEFSLLFGIDAKIVIVSSNTEAAIKVRMKWG